MLCPRCHNPMRNTMHFEQGKRYQFNECSKCHERTKKKRIHFEDVLQDEINKLNKRNETSQNKRSEK